MNHFPNHGHQQNHQQHQKPQVPQPQQPAVEKATASSQDNLAAILERASRKLNDEIAPIDTLTHKQAVLEQRLRITDETLNKLCSQQLRLGIDNVPRQHLQELLQAGNVPFEPHFNEDKLRELVRNFLSSI